MTENHHQLLQNLHLMVVDLKFENFEKLYVWMSEGNTREKIQSEDLHLMKRWNSKEEFCFVLIADLEVLFVSFCFGLTSENGILFRMEDT